MVIEIMQLVVAQTALAGMEVGGVVIVMERLVEEGATFDEQLAA